MLDIVKNSNFQIKHHPEFDDHEQIVFGEDQEAGLLSIIAIHNTQLGPALGGCRMWEYESQEDAISDVLRLSKGMTYKNALAGLNFGGGKAVIIGNSRTDKSEELLLAFAQQIQSLNGQYITGEDLGISCSDMEKIYKITPFVRGIKETGLGDPSPYTAQGVFIGLKEAVNHKFGTNDLRDLRVCIQGLGNVGYKLAKLVHASGAKLIVSDLHSPTVNKVAVELNAEIVAPQDAHVADVDVYSPCALGAILNQSTIPEIKAKVVVGAANNQLAKDSDGQLILDHDILYVPDYVVNSGGAISIALSQANGDDKSVLDHIFAISQTLSNIFKRADRENVPTNIIANKMALERLKLAPTIV